MVPEFVIHELALGGGLLAISPMPGRTRHYAADLRRLLDWRPALVVTMVPLYELARKGAAGLPADLAAHRIGWAHLPVEDYGVPGPEVEVGWPAIAARVLNHLAESKRILVHCHGGCGRSGMAVLRLMIAAGEAPDAALVRLRQARPCAVETAAQMEWAGTQGRA
jgi:protein-tyrosine phosphatase